jgi:hypothetical protein
LARQKTVITSRGPITVSSLTVAELRQLHDLMIRAELSGKFSELVKVSPIIFASTRRVHQELSLEQMEEQITLADLGSLLTAALEVSSMQIVSGGFTPKDNSRHN